MLQRVSYAPVTPVKNELINISERAAFWKLVINAGDNEFSTALQNAKNLPLTFLKRSCITYALLTS